jgi:hypothetical protein
VILVDTAIWIDHIRSADTVLSALLDSERVLVHPAVIVEIALCRLRNRDATIRLLKRMPNATAANDREVLGLIDAFALTGRGIGYVDIHLLASAKLDGASLWTRDKRLHAAAVELGIAATV